MQTHPAYCETNTTTRLGDEGINDLINDRSRSYSSRLANRQAARLLTKLNARYLSPQAQTAFRGNAFLLDALPRPADAVIVDLCGVEYYSLAGAGGRGSGGMGVHTRSYGNKISELALTLEPSFSGLDLRSIIGAHKIFTAQPARRTSFPMRVHDSPSAARRSNRRCR